jgi:hypothetical protein
MPAGRKQFAPSSSHLDLNLILNKSRVRSPQP